MKKLKVFLATFVAVLATVLGSTALADTYTITIQNPNFNDSGVKIGDGNTYNFEGRIYEAYQIFAGNYSQDADGGKVLADIKWGASINDAGKQALADAVGVADKNDASAIAAALATSKNGTSFADVAGALSDDGTSYKYLTTVSASSAASKQNETNVTITGLTAGYYFVADKLGLLKDSNRAYSHYILQVVGNTSVKSKLSIPKVDKKVEGENDSTGKATGWYDSADYDLNDEIPFRLTATLPELYADYRSYYLSFVDTPSDALSYIKGSYHVYVTNNDGTTKQEITKQFTEDTTSTAGKIKFTINDLKKVTTDDSGANVAINASSKIVVEYKAKLVDNNLVIGSDNDAIGNQNKVYLEYSNNPNWNGNGEKSPKGKTPDDIVTVFTFQLTINKVKENGETPLSGATFTLEKRIADGDVSHWKTIGLVKSEDGTSFSVKGLDAGDYKLEETAAPTGYNKLTAPIYFRVTSTKDLSSDLPKITNLTVTRMNADFATGQKTSEQDASVNITDGLGKMVAKVVNGKGSTLPETGSVGTRILYTVGAILVLGAGILLITKKRMEAK